MHVNLRTLRVVNMRSPIKVNQKYLDLGRVNLFVT